MKTKIKIQTKAKKERNSTFISREIYEPDKNNINKHCHLLHCEYADITPDDVGRIIGVIEDGYEVEFCKKFKVGNDYIHDTRVIFGLAKDMVLI